MLRADFELLLKQRIHVVAGSLSSELARRSSGELTSTARCVVEFPDRLRQVHADYASAGAVIHVTATSEANAVALGRLRLLPDLDAINQNGALLCRESVPNHHFVFGGMGSTGALLKPYGPLTESDYRDVFARQGALLLGAGVDGFFLEGFSSLIEAEQCVLALRRLTSIPVVATMSLLEDGRTTFGDSMETCFKNLHEKGADVVGIQGALGPLEVDTFLGDLPKRFRICVRPNAGYPVKVGKAMTYLSSPEYVAEFAEQFWSKGAVIIGGAAGFSPEHIDAVAKRLRNRRPNPIAERTAMEPAAARTVADTERDQVTQVALSRKMAERPILSVELEPPRGLEIEQVIGLIEAIKSAGVDAINIPENPLARARISSIALARTIRDRTGLDSIAHVTCRDRNLISLQAELLGAHVLGIHNILALTGDPSGHGDFPAATSIFDLNSLGLVELMTRMNMGKDFGMNDLGSPTQFNIGVAANPVAADLDAELERLEAKIARGATFVQTQPIFDPAAVAPFLRAMEGFQVPVIFGVMPIRDYRHARYLVNEYPGIRIREADLRRFADAPADAQAGLSQTLARELIAELRPLSGGVYVMPAFGNAEDLTAILCG